VLRTRHGAPQPLTPSAVYGPIGSHLANKDAVM